MRNKSLLFKVSKIISTIFVINLLGLANPSIARAECQSKACIDVYVKDGKLVIDGRKDGSTTKPVPKPVPKSTPRPSFKPTQKPVPKPPRKTYQQPASPRPTVTTPSMADRILESLPTLQVAYQPESAALIRVPVIFFTDLPTFFNKTYRIIGIPVSVNLRPNSLWDFGDGSTDTLAKPTHTYSGAGTYIVKLKACNYGYCDSTVYTVTIHPNPPLPTIGVSGITLTSNQTTGNQWYLNNSPITGATNQTYTVTMNGIYKVEYTDIFGCSSVSDSVMFTTVGFPNLNNLVDEIKLYPNPAISDLQILNSKKK